MNVSKENAMNFLESSLEHSSKGFGSIGIDEHMSHCQEYGPVCKNAIHVLSGDGKCTCIQSCDKDKAQDIDDGPKKFKVSFTRRQWIALIICALANFGCAICVSLQAPFFPREAMAKGFGAGVYSLVFSCFSFTVFLIAPLIGKYIGIIGPQFTLNAGIFITSTCCILFGLLGTAAPMPFITLSFVVRIVEAMGEAAYTTASFTIIADEFPDHIGTTFAVIRGAFGTGLILGPTLGSILYSIGGYHLPFSVMGGILFFLAICTRIVFWGRNDISNKKKAKSIIKIIRIPSVFLCGIVTCSAAMSVGFLMIGLEPHFESSFQLNPLEIGLMFAISGSVFAVTSVIWGTLCDKKIHPKLLTTFGFLFVCITYFLLGPPPFMPFEGAVWINAVALMFHGLGMGGELLPPYVDAITEAVRHGFPDDNDTCGMIGGLWSGTFQLGNALGPLICGQLVEFVGFRWTTVIVLGYQAFIGLIVFIFYMRTRRRDSMLPSKLAREESQNNIIHANSHNNITHEYVNKKTPNDCLYNNVANETTPLIS